MQEHKQSNNNNVQPLENGVNPPKSKPRGRQQPQGGQEDIAKALGEFMEYLKESERAKNRVQQTHRREVVDLAALGDWLARAEKMGAPGKNPGDSLVANRERASGRGRSQEKSKGWSPAHQPSQPAKVFSSGDVKTKVWANYPTPGSLTWNIQQVRVYRGPKGELMEARSFRLDDLRDAMRGAYRAERWIRRQDRRHRLFGWFLGF